ncbi:MAG: band 7 protein [Gemmatimonadetes bacterium]|nr:band 7 protein [Gemmatimonadota bacterium]
MASTMFDPETDSGRKLKRAAVALVAVVALLFLLPSTFTYVNPGYVGIVIHRAGGGVDPVPLGPGIHARMPFATGIEEYPIFLKTLILAKSSNEGSGFNDEINVNSVEGQPLALDVSLSFQLDPAQTPKLYTMFRTDINQITHGFVKQAIRQALQEIVGTEPVADVIGPKKAEATSRVYALVSKRLQPMGFDVKQFTINELRAPPAVMEAINQKNVMQQQALTAQNELQKNTFNAQGDSIKAAGRAKAITAEAEAQAHANELLAKSITPTLVQYEITKKWDGKLPQVSGGATPLIQLPTKP